MPLRRLGRIDSGRMARREAVLLLVVLVVGAVLRGPFLFAGHREGDERDARALIGQLSRGEYSLHHASELSRVHRRGAYMDAPVYHHPPLYYGLGWVMTQLAGEGGPYLISYLASLAVLALVFLSGTLLRDPETGFVAAAILLLCPITQLVAGKVWAESLLALLLCALIYLTYQAAGSAAPPSKRSIALFFALGCAIVLTRQTGVFALGFVLPMLVCAPHARALRPRLLAAAAGLLAGLLAWLAVSALGTGSVIPAAVMPDASAGKQSGFVAMLLRRNPWSFLYVPLLLSPLYAFGLALLRPGERTRTVLPLALFALGYAGGLTLLAALTPISYHMKYVAPAVPALALAAAIVLVPLARRSPALGALIAVCSLAYAAPMLHEMTLQLPAMAEVDPRFFYMVFDALPW